MQSLCRLWVLNRLASLLACQMLIGLAAGLLVELTGHIYLPHPGPPHPPPQPQPQPQPPEQAHSHIGYCSGSDNQT